MAEAGHPPELTVPASTWETLRDLAVAKTTALITSGKASAVQIATIAGIAERNVREPVAPAADGLTPDAVADYVNELEARYGEGYASHALDALIVHLEEAHGEPEAARATNRVTDLPYDPPVFPRADPCPFQPADDDSDPDGAMTHHLIAWLDSLGDLAAWQAAKRQQWADYYRAVDEHVARMRLYYASLPPSPVDALRAEPPPSQLPDSTPQPKPALDSPTAPTGESTRRSRWGLGLWDHWGDDDPAIRRMREALR
jgi:hypothetical protein